jgi:hypothetical protein
MQQEAHRRNTTARGTVARIGTLFLLMVCIVGLQVRYDALKPSFSGGVVSTISPQSIRLMDLGFHGATASFLWVGTLPKILNLFFNGNMEYVSDLDFLNGVDPRFGYPYAFSVLTIPVSHQLKNPDVVALQIGREGIANADPDWRIPYYMAADYFLDLKDERDALYYYDVAARTPGIPQYAKVFALNFGAIPSERKKSEALWATIRDTAPDDFTKERAQAYIDHYEIFDYLQAAANTYKNDFGSYPKTVQDLFQKKIIPGIPRDPLGFSFVIGADGTVGIDQTNVPKN